MATLLPRQNIIEQAVEVKSTFSSWDGCMAKSYCKWPAIIGIVVGTLMVISLLWCISRCICCGKDLVCCCCRCCGRDKGHKHLDSVPSTPHNNQGQYQSHGAPIYAGPGAFSQTATFDGATKIHADSLPAMPSWDTAASRKVEVIEEAAPESHEMDRLRTNGSPAPRSDTASPLARPIPMQDRAGSPYGSRTNLSNAGYGGGATAGAQPGYGEDRYGSNPYGARAPRSPVLPGYAAPSSPSPYGPATPSSDRYGAGTSPYGASTNPYGGNSTSYGVTDESTNPYGGGATGYGGNSGGYGGNSGGHGASSSPYGSSTAAYSGGSNAYGGGGSNAYGGNSNSYGNNNRYGGGNTSNSPYGQYNNSRPAGNGWRDI